MRHDLIDVFVKNLIKLINSSSIFPFFGVNVKNIIVQHLKIQSLTLLYTSKLQYDWLSKKNLLMMKRTHLVRQQTKIGR